MEPNYDMHLGLVVSSSPDPENRNRVQVWIPYLSNTLYEPLNKKLKDVKFKSPEDLQNIDSSILTILQTTLPWAEYAAPVFGGSSGAFNTTTGQTAVNSGSTIQGAGNAAPIVPTTTLNMTTSGVKPAENVGSVQIYKNILNTAGDSKVISRQPRNSFYPGVYGHWCEAGASAVASVLVGGSSGANAIDSQLGANAWDSRNLYSNVKVNNQNVWNPSTPATLNQINNATPGSVLFFRSANGDVGHTMTYVGNGYWSSDNTLDDPAKFLNSSNYDAVSIATPTDYGQSLISQNWPGLESYNGKIASTPVIEDKTNAGAKSVVFTDRAAATGSVVANVGIPGSPVGTFSTPNAGTKVWVFFIGGDVQRPVYFAQAPNPGDINALHG